HKGGGRLGADAECWVELRAFGLAIHEVGGIDGNEEIGSCGEGFGGALVRLLLLHTRQYREMYSRRETEHADFSGGELQLRSSRTAGADCLLHVSQWRLARLLAFGLGDTVCDYESSDANPLEPCGYLSSLQVISQNPVPASGT